MPVVLTGVGLLDIKFSKLCGIEQNVFVFLFPSSIQRDLYEESFRSLVESVLGGYNGKTLADPLSATCC